MFERFKTIWKGIEQRVAAQQLRLLSSLYVQPFNFFSSQSRVRAEIALSLSACWCPIDRIRSELTVCPIEVYKRRPDNRGAGVAYDHYLTPLLHGSPDGIHTAFNHRKQTVAHILGYGNGYHERVTTNGGKVLELPSVHPNQMEPKLINGKRLFSFNNGEVLLPPENVVHMYGLSYDSFSGISPIRASSTTLAAGMSADAYSLGYFDNNATPSGFIRFPGKYSPEFEKNFKDSWQEGHQGVERSNKIGLLFGGAEFQQGSLSPLDSQLVEQKRYTVSDIARIYHSIF
jgi:HK97 family phage portal protein